MPSRLILIGLTSLFLTACGTLSGLNSTLPPNHLLESCPEPSWPVSGGTNADLARLLSEYQLSLDLCNADKAGLRAWAEGLQSTEIKTRD